MFYLFNENKSKNKLLIHIYPFNLYLFLIHKLLLVNFEALPPLFNKERKYVAINSSAKVVTEIFILGRYVALWARTVYNKNGQTLKQFESRKYPTASGTDGHYTDDISLFIVKISHYESLLNSQEKVASDINVCVNTDKTVLIYFNQ